jgi:hypothetical protein
VFYIVNQIFYPHGLTKVIILKLWSFTSQYYEKALCSGLKVFTKMIKNKLLKKYLKIKSFTILMAYLSFDNNELFTYDELEMFLDANPVAKSEMLANVFIERLLINQDTLYMYQSKSVTYKMITTIHTNLTDYLAMLSRKLIVESYEKLVGECKRRIDKMYPYNTVCSMESYKDYALDILFRLSNDDIQFDANTDKYVHYLNGYLNLTTKKFLKRDSDRHYISQYYAYDYVDKKQEVKPAPTTKKATPKKAIPKKTLKKAIDEMPESDEEEEEDGDDEDPDDISQEDIDELVDVL